MRSAGSRPLPILAALLVVAGLGGVAQAQRKKRPVKPACDLSYLPFRPGATWTYDSFVPGDAPDRKGIYVQDPPSFTAKVTGIRKDGDTTVIELEESYRKVVRKTELRCDKAGLTVTPQSFFFAGEVGGGLGIELADLKREGDEYPDKKGLKSGSQFYEELKAKATRVPTANSNAVLAPETLELERKLTVGGKEEAESKVQVYRATRVEVEMTGRANQDGQPDDKAFNMPAVRSVMWFVGDVGVVRVETSQGVGWQLSAYDDGSQAATAAPAN
jgi:hypothetical protein